MKDNYGELRAWIELRHEQGVDCTTVLTKLAAENAKLLSQVQKARPKPGAFPYDEPTDLAAIRQARPRGRHTLPFSLTAAQLRSRMRGAWLGRSAGCILGIPVEGWPHEHVADFARQQKLGVPPTGYWKIMPRSYWMHYSEPKHNFLAGNIDHVGPDDDLAYTVLGLLVLEEYGPDFTPADVGAAWLKYLPMACTAEHVAL